MKPWYTWCIITDVSHWQPTWFSPWWGMEEQPASCGTEPLSCHLLYLSYTFSSMSVSAYTPLCHWTPCVDGLLMRQWVWLRSQDSLQSAAWMSKSLWKLYLDPHKKKKKRNRHHPLTRSFPRAFTMDEVQTLDVIIRSLKNFFWPLAS